MTLFGVFLVLIIVGVVLWGVNALPMIEANIKKIITVLTIVFVVIWLISLFFPGLTGIRVPAVR